MLDDEFLQQAVAAATFLSLAYPKQMISIKKLDSVQIFCSDHLAKLIGIELNQLLGTKAWQCLYDNDPELEKIILNEDKEIIESREGKMLLKINRFSTGLTPYLGLKIPLINPATHNVVGLLCHGWEIGANLTGQMISQLNSMKKPVNLSNAPKLTKREKEVIFFFMANLSSQEIAEMLSKIDKKVITKSTVDSIFNDQLYKKFEVYNRVALYKKLQALGYDQLIPKELLSITSVMLDIMRSY